MNDNARLQATIDVKLLIGSATGIYVAPDKTITFVADKLRLADVDLLASWFQTNRINFVKGQDMTTAGAAGYEVEIFGPQL